MGQNLIDKCPIWVSIKKNKIMNLSQIDFSKTLSDGQVFDTIMSNYSDLSKDWIFHQWNWMNSVYLPFKDHYKYMIIISLVEKTLQFYNQMNIQYTYDEYYSKSYLQIEKFSITELCEKLDLPKETVRRKVLELEKEGVIARIKKKIVIDRKAFGFVTGAIQKSLLNKKGTLSLKFSDLFNTSKSKSESFRDTFYRKSEGRWRMPTYVLTFSYRFNDNKYKQRKKNIRRNQGDFDQGGGEEPIFNN